MKIERFNEKNIEYDIYFQTYKLDEKDDKLRLISNLNELEENDVNYYLFSKNNSYDVIIYFKRTPKFDSLLGFYDNSSYSNISEVKKTITSSGYTLIERDYLENLKFIISSNKFNI